MKTVILPRQNVLEVFSRKSRKNFASRYQAVVTCQTYEFPLDIGMLPRSISFKTSVALGLSALNLPAKKFHQLVGRDKPAGQHHMRYTPEDIRVARYRHAGLLPEVFHQTAPEPAKLRLIVTRMTKGGVGKTSVSVNVACSLAAMGYRVLVIDADPQATASNLLGIDSASDSLTHIGKFLVRKTAAPDRDLGEAIVHVYEGGYLDLIPADITLAETDASLVAAMASHERAHAFLSRNAAHLSAHYDVIVVDTAPGTTPIGLAFTYAAKVQGKVLTVVEPEGSCLRALDSLQSNLAEIAAVTGARIGLEVVINQYHPQLRHVRDSMGSLYARFGTMLNEHIIPSYAGFARQLNPQTREAVPLVESEPASSGASAIIDLAKSLVLSFGITQPGLPATKEEVR